MYQEIPFPNSLIFESLWRSSNSPNHLICADACSDLIVQIDGQKIDYFLSYNQLSTIYSPHQTDTIFYGLRLQPAALSFVIPELKDAYNDSLIASSYIPQLSIFYSYFIEWHETGSAQNFYNYLQKKEEQVAPCLSLYETQLVQHFWQQYSLDDIIKHSGYSARHFRRKIQQQMGCSPYHLYRIFRMNKAIDLKNQARLNDIDIALECGFSDQAHMLNDIHKLTGEKFSTWK